MRIKINEQVASQEDAIKVNISAMANEYPNVDYNEIRDTLVDMGATVMGQVGNGSLEEGDNDDNNVYMVISGVSEEDVIDTIQDVVSEYENVDIEPTDYFIENEPEAKAAAIHELKDEYGDKYIDMEDDMIDECDFPSYEDVDNDLEDKDVSIHDLNDEYDDNIDMEDDMFEENDFPSYDDIEEEPYAKSVANDDLTDEYDEELECLEHAFNKIKRYNALNEKRKGCCPPKKIALLEALKAYDAKKQKNVEASEKAIVTTIDDIVNAARGKFITPAMAKEALAKLKKENKALSKIAKNEKGDTLRVKDVKGGKVSLAQALTLLKKNVEDDKVKEQIDNFSKEIKEAVVTSLKNNKAYLYENVKVNGKLLRTFSIKELKALLKETKSVKESLVNKLKNSLNESVDNNIKDSIAKKTRLLNILDEELTYRITRNECLRKINEDTNDDMLANMFGDTPDVNTSSDENTSSDAEDTENVEDTEEIDLARVCITLQNKEAAEDLMQQCIDAGIPEDALKIEDESDSSDENSDDAENNDNAEANESKAYSYIYRLFEDEKNTDDVPADDVPADDDMEEEHPVKLVLVDTDYTTKLASILDDVYGITKEEFEDMIGGEIVEDSTDNDDDTNSDAEDAEDDDIDPSDIFKGL